MPESPEPTRPIDPSARPEPDPGTVYPRLERSWDRLPKAVRFTLGCLAVVAVIFMVNGLPNLLFEDESSGRWIYTLGVLALAAVSFAVTLRWQRRALGGAEQMRMFRQALKDGEVPPTANREAWRTALERQTRSMAWARLFHFVAHVVPALVAVVVIVVLIVDGSMPLGAVVAFAVVGAIVTVTLWFGSRTLRRQQQRVATLLERL